MLPLSLLLAGTAPSASPLSNRASAHPELFFIPARLLCFCFFFFYALYPAPGRRSLQRRTDQSEVRDSVVGKASPATDNPLADPRVGHREPHRGAHLGEPPGEPLAGQASGRRATGTGRWAGASVCGIKSVRRVIQPPSQDLPQTSENEIRAQNLLRSSRFSSHDTGIPILHRPLITYVARGSFCYRPSIFAARSPV